MEYGKVHGPYKGKYGRMFVVVVYHNIDGSIKQRKTIPYEVYLAEKEKGNYNFDLTIFAKHNKEARNRIKKNPVLIHTECSFCKIPLQRYENENKPRHFCSKSCGEKFRRRESKKSKLVFKDQYVVFIKEHDKQHCIVYERNQDKRSSYFIPHGEWKLVISEDSNLVPLFRLVYTKEQAVRIKPVKGYKKYFWITETGILISRRTKRILSQTLTENGYLTHTTKIGGRRGSNLCFRIHRLVASVFVPNPENKPEVNHLDGVKTNNKYNNLEWVTGAENIEHAVENGLMKPLLGELSSSAKLTNQQAIEIRNLWASGNYRIVDLERLFNVSSRIIIDVVYNRTFRHLL